MTRTCRRWLLEHKNEHSELVLRLFGDSLSHNLRDTCQQTYLLGFHKKMPYPEFVKHFKDVVVKLVWYRKWIKRDEKKFTIWDSTWRLTRLGDEALREIQIRRGGDYLYYKYFRRPQASQPLAV